jgi:hypothetical protein
MVRNVREVVQDRTISRIVTRDASGPTTGRDVTKNDLTGSVGSGSSAGIFPLRDRQGARVRDSEQLLDARHHRLRETALQRGHLRQMPNCDGSHPVFGATVIRTRPDRMRSDRAGLLASRSIY